MPSGVRTFPVFSKIPIFATTTTNRRTAQPSNISYVGLLTRRCGLLEKLALRRHHACAVACLSVCLQRLPVQDEKLFAPGEFGEHGSRGVGVAEDREGRCERLGRR